MKQLTGTGVALVTPFNEHLELDLEALANVVRHGIQGGVDYLVVLGTTGESVTLSKQEKEAVIQTVIEVNKGQLPLVLGMGGNNTRALIKEFQETNLDPFDAILSVSPYYNKPTQEGIYQHYRALALASSKPVILYNVPGRTGSNILPETTLRLARDFENIIGVKEASGNMGQIREILAGMPAGFMVISGDDATARETIEHGGHGVISVLGQALPEPFTAMIKAAMRGEQEEAKALEKQLLQAMDLIFQEGNPAGIKAMFEVLGLCGAGVRLPLVEASDSLKARIAECVRTLEQIQA
ncbi:4-hydroxy-tetrahydrodipicolinate synthase [Lentiprolixibacter aurantiacus]|uniref:4-hydroxy-tetrahydrodipicolinate synthase n=1 Tax=Lentiprolixibacter aurantiacus TaxID=2993939 RepID=A0AAE3MM26_9FLAO|nr:4-hydroxy-tetrahydrodipicolinate synthase [Lentiprolixibacter aurantiacus]MCX2719377.1 4-hydroxy-tetrahydrodipicolinate synthase [Lentiprolixibacter aurantiacus]